MVICPISQAATKQNYWPKNPSHVLKQPCFLSGQVQKTEKENQANVPDITAKNHDEKILLLDVSDDAILNLSLKTSEK